MEENSPALPEDCVLDAYRGSQAHGTYLGGGSFDDVDLLRVVMPSLEECFGAIQSRWTGSDHKEGKWDIATYEFRHWVNLLAKGNPNAVGSLFLRTEDVLHSLWPYHAIRAIRRQFITKRMGMAFSGYAYSQMKRMTAFQKYEGYMGEKRKALVDEFGYDVKNAAHLIRLLRMGREALETGELQVFRKYDAEELIAIKTGKKSFEDIQKMSEEEWARFDEALKKTEVLDDIPKDTVNHVTTDILQSWFHQKRFYDGMGRSS
jgi:uncharacterized protein